MPWDGCEKTRRPIRYQGLGLGLGLVYCRGSPATRRADRLDINYAPFIYICYTLFKQYIHVRVKHWLAIYIFISIYLSTYLSLSIYLYTYIPTYLAPGTALHRAYCATLALWRYGAASR